MAAERRRRGASLGAAPACFLESFVYEARWMLCCRPDALPTGRYGNRVPNAWKRMENASESRVCQTYVMTAETLVMS